MDRSGHEEMPPIDGSPLFHFDVEHLRLRNARTGRQCALTRNEALLLDALVAGVCAKPDLIDEVWTRQGTIVTENSYYQLVSLLRKSFASIDLAGTVVTIPRKGLTLHGAPADASIESAGEPDLARETCDLQVRADERSNGIHRSPDRSIDHSTVGLIDRPTDSSIANPIDSQNVSLPNSSTDGPIDGATDSRMGRPPGSPAACRVGHHVGHSENIHSDQDADRGGDTSIDTPVDTCVESGIESGVESGIDSGFNHGVAITVDCGIDNAERRGRLAFVAAITVFLACVIVMAFRLGAALSNAGTTPEDTAGVFDPPSAGQFIVDNAQIRFTRIPAATARRVWDDVAARVDVPLEQRDYIYITAYRNRYAVLACSEPPQLWLARCVTVTESL